jgi:hypothetical protein
MAALKYKYLIAHTLVTLKNNKNARQTANIGDQLR